MNMARLAYRNWRYKPGQSWALMGFVFLAATLVAFSAQWSDTAQRSFHRALDPVDLVIGAKGSDVQLLLSAVYHIDDPVGNLDSAAISGLKDHPQVTRWVPIAMGDQIQGFRMVGTTPEFLELYNLKPEQGTTAPITGDHNVWVGGWVARALNLKVGDALNSTHGLAETGKKHDHPFRVAGILAMSGLPADQLVLAPVSAIWELHGEETRGQITAALVQTRSAMGKVIIPGQVNRANRAQAILPSVVMAKVRRFGVVGTRILQWVSGAFFLLAALGIFLGMWQRLISRKDEWELLRAMGWRKGHLALCIWMETVLFIVVPLIPALLTAKAVLQLSSTFWYRHYGIFVEWQWWHMIDTRILSGTILMAAIMGGVPAIWLFRHPLFIRRP